MHPRLIASLLACAAGVALMVASPLAAVPVGAATTGAGISGITPYGGYLGNYIAPDGTRVYCIDASRDWPSGSTSSGVVTSSLDTGWGAALSSETLQKFNYALARYGQTNEAVQAAAMSAYLYAYTSGYARTHGASYEAGLHYINGNGTVEASYAAIWVDAETLFASTPAPTAELSIEMTEPRAGTVQVTTNPVGAEGTLTLEGAVAADTQENTLSVTGGELVEIEGAPGAEQTSYTIAASADFSAQSGYGPQVTLYTTGDQQRTIRDAGPATVAFTSSASLDVVLPTPTPTPTPTPDQPQPAVAQLAQTGAPSDGMLAAGVALIAVGALLPLARSRREYRRTVRVIPSRE